MSRTSPGTGGLGATLVTAAVAATVAGGACFLLLRALERRRNQSQGEGDGHHSADASTAVSQRCWQWLNEADKGVWQDGDGEPQSPRNGGDSASNSGGSGVNAGAQSMRSDSRSWLDMWSADSDCRMPVPDTSARRVAGRGGGWGDVLAGVQPPRLPVSLRSRGGSAVSGGSREFRSEGSQAAAPHAPQQTMAQALTTSASSQPLLPQRMSPDSQSDDDSSGTVQLDELQLCQNPDGSPQLLGRGGFGQVYKAFYQSELVAVKVFPLDAHAKGEANFRKEIALLRSCQHENIVGFRAACLDAPNHLLMVMELAEGGDLRLALDNDKSGELRWYTRQRGPHGEPQPGLGKAIALGISRGLEFLHARHIVHLDLKSANVLLSADKVAKVADVGLARFMPADYLSQAAAVGTFAWTAPEVLMGTKCGTRVDVFSLGVILWELVTGEAPHRGRMRPLRVPEECSAGVADLVSACMEQRAARRPSIAEVVRLLSGDAALLDATRVPAFEIDAQSDDEQASVSQSDAQDLREFYNSWTTAVYGSLDSAFAAGYTEEPLETIVQCVRPADGRTYATMINELGEKLKSPDVEDPSSAARARCLALVGTFIDVYLCKVQLSGRLAVEMQSTDGDGVASDDYEVVKSDVRKHVHASSAASDKERTQLQDWRPTLQAIRLTPGQADALAEARQQLGARLSDLRSRRRGLVAKLRSLMEASDFGGSLDASTSLRASIKEESVALYRFQAWLLREALHPLQLARAMVASHPFLIDGPQLGALLLHDRGSPLARDAP